MIEKRHKRSLPARHSFLTDAVSSVLKTQSTIHVPQIDCRTVLKLTNKTSDCIDYGEPEPLPQPSLDTQRVFRLLPQRRPIVSKNSVCIPDDYYLARHRKHEMEEKKQKNREKERLEHELYQQQQLVERLKTMDKSTLASIVSSLRSNSHDNSSINGDGHRHHHRDRHHHRRHRHDHHQDTYTSMTPAELEHLHQTLLQDAREQMYRYEQLGLGRKRGQGFSAHSHRSKLIEEAPSTMVPVLESTSLSPPKTPTQSSPAPSSPPSTLPTTSTGVRTSDAMEKRRRMERERILKVLAHLKSHGHPTTAGQRRSLRTAIAFGDKIPAMNDEEFKLPEDLFGELISKRLAR